MECRYFHSSSSLLSGGPLGPLLPENQPKEDQFSEMMNDRTNSLFRSLGIDATQFEKQPSVPKNGSADARTSQSSEENNKAKENATVSSLLSNDLTKLPSFTPKSPTSFYIDTQDIYAELRSAGLSRGLAELLMRVIQELINDLVLTCKERAVPNSAAANEAYLFDAASSEVRNEIITSRQTQATTYRSGVARLQRDVEILEHIATEMTNLLKSDMDFEVHERKNAARGEENVIQLKIQELNNKISTRLNSDLKSEIENLRWQITRRSLAAIGVVAALFIWNTQTTSSKKTAKTEERQRNTAGKPVPVHILAPSMAVSEELPYETPSPVHVEDLNSMVTPYSPPVTDAHSDNKEKTESGETPTANDSNEN